MKFLLFIGLLVVGLFAEQVQITADSFDGDENALVANLNGNVTIKNGKYDTLQANKAKILFDKNKKPIKYTASGNARFKAELKGKRYDGSSDEISYEPASQIYILSGKAYLHEIDTDKKLYGNKITINQKKGTYSVDGDGAPIKFIFDMQDKK